jgi:Arc/MetJ family transcription regulator
MRKTTLIIDDELIEQARRVLGTRGIKDTIDRALEEVVVADARRALMRRLASQDGLDLGNEDVMRRAWEE